MEVKTNNSNGQKYISIPKNSFLKDGDSVDVIKKNIYSEIELNKFYNANKKEIDLMHKELNEYSSSFPISPEFQFSEYLEKKFNIKQNSEGDEGYDLTIGKVWVSVSSYYDEIYDKDNYFEPNDFDGEDLNIFKSIIHDEIEEGFSFDEEYFESKYKNFEDSMKMNTYLNIKEKLMQKYDDTINEILKRYNYDFVDWGGNICNSEHCDIYRHNITGTYLLINLGYDQEEIIIVNQPENYGDLGDSYKELEIKLNS
jgi:hypothetical protein